MIIYDKDKINKISKWKDGSFYILTDFDRTITTYDSKTSWSILYDNEKLDKNYKNTTNKLFEFYRPIEIDEEMDFNKKNKLMIEWWTKNISLFIEYKLTEDIIIDAIKDIKVLKFRDGAIDLLSSMKERNIPVIIISAGIGNIIEKFLKNNNCYFDNIYIVSNFIKFENGVAVGLEDNIIHSLNKNEALLDNNIKKVIKDRPNIILLGDQIADTKMISADKEETCIKIGFCEEKEDDNYKFFEREYDIVCTNKTTFIDLSNEINLLK